MKTKLFLAGLAFMAITSWAVAQDNPGNNTPQTAPGKGSAYVDNNKNGVCDNFESRTSVKSDTATTMSGMSGGKGMQEGCCKGKGAGNGSGMGRNFTDENKNGVCDRKESASTN